jgi:hypothetical protein
MDWFSVEPPLGAIPVGIDATHGPELLHELRCEFFVKFFGHVAQGVFERQFRFFPIPSSNPGYSGSSASSFIVMALPFSIFFSNIHKPSFVLRRSDSSLPTVFFILLPIQGISL